MTSFVCRFRSAFQATARLFVVGILFAASAGLGSQSVDLATDPWRLQLDEKAAWRDDPLFLPDEVDLVKIPSNPPTGGWGVLSAAASKAVTLPSTVEEHFWGKTAIGERPYAAGEYFYWHSDPGVKNGNYLGVSWWSREFSAPTLKPGQRLVINFRGARLRAEVYVNHQLVGYNLITEVPFTADVTGAVKTGEGNQLDVRITNPGGFLDWTDWGPPIKWGKYDIPRSHGFGGLDAGIVMEIRDAVAVRELAILNRPSPRHVDLVIDVASTGPEYAGPVALSISRAGSVVWKGEFAIVVPAGGVAQITREVWVPSAALWDIDHPNLYEAVAELPNLDNSGRTVSFGFRWFAPEGIGEDAQFRLNDRRIVLRSAISWGYWMPNGLWPTDVMAEKEVRVAKSLGLNSLQFHRNIGRPNVLDAHDRLGLLRYEEPGAGRNAYMPLDVKGGIASPTGPISQPPFVLTGEGNPPSEWRMRYEIAKILGMVRRDRSHPSLVLYCIQNEQNPPLSWPAIPWLFRRIQEIDPSRTVYLHSGVAAHNQLVALPYTAKLLHEDGTGYSGWFDKHTVGGPGVYQDGLYKSPQDFSHYSDNKKEIVTWGEMLGVGVPDDHEAILEWYREHGLSGYDVGVHENALGAYNTFLDRWKFREAYPTASKLFRDVGARSYYFWAKIMEQARACNENDSLVISGWESTTIENHSGIVDTLRNFRADPDILRRSLQPEVLVVRPRHLVLTPGEEAIVDIHLVNEVNRQGPHLLRFEALASNGVVIYSDKFNVKVAGGNLFGQLLQENIRFPISTAGTIIVRATLEPSVQPAERRLTGEGELFVVEPAGSNGRLGRVGLIEEDGKIAAALRATISLETNSELPGHLNAVIVASGATWEGKVERSRDKFSNAADAKLFEFMATGQSGVIATLRNLAPGRATVELFFGEESWQEAGRRVFDVAINGQVLLKDFDVFKEAGGRYRALVKTFEVELNSSELRLEVPRVTADQATFAGIRLTDSTGRVVAVAFRDTPYIDPTGCEWMPFAAASVLINESKMTDLLTRVEQDGLRLVFCTNGVGDAAEIARRLAQHGLIQYRGTIAEARDPWMGSWYFARKHWLFDGLPADCVLGWQYQIPAAGSGVGGLLVESVPGKLLEVVVGYGRDHEALVGMGACIIHYGKGVIVLPAIPGLRSSITSATGVSLTQPVARRLLTNALRAELP